MPKAEKGIYYNRKPQQHIGLHTLTKKTHSLKVDFRDSCLLD